MVRFYENLTGNREGLDKQMPTAEALGEAKSWLRTVRDANGKRPFLHPTYWAGFTLVGCPR